MKEFTITVTSDRGAADNPWESLGTPPAGPVQPMALLEKKPNRITNVTLTAHLTDVEYEEAQALLEKMKDDAKKT